MIVDHPWFGTGQGTFAYAFPAYRSDKVSMWGVWDIAHNTLLEIASDMGVPIAALVVVAWVVIFAVLIHGMRVRRHDRIFPIAALAVGILAVLHSLIDFTLQIPGYAIVALSLIGAGLAQSFATSQTNIAARAVSRMTRDAHGRTGFAASPATEASPDYGENLNNELAEADHLLP